MLFRCDLSNVDLNCYHDADLVLFIIIFDRDHVAVLFFVRIKFLKVKSDIGTLFAWFFMTGICVSAAFCVTK